LIEAAVSRSSNSKRRTGPKDQWSVRLAARVINARCPHYHQLIELIEEKFEQIDCPSCGNWFSRVPELITTLEGKVPVKTVTHKGAAGSANSEIDLIETGQNQARDQCSF
jgi:hypothetical protein